MADLADHAHAHAVAILGPGQPAIDAAVLAVRRGGRARWAVLGHARAEALARVVDADGVDLDGPVPDDLVELAGRLAWTRPSLERAVVDLDARHGLDRVDLGRALGTSTASAGARAADVAATWTATLDPVLLARLGPAGCDGLAAVLGAPVPPSAAGSGDDGARDDLDDGGPGAGPSGDHAAGEATPSAPSDVPLPATLRELLALGPAVADHVAGCAACGDRVRSMVSVRTLLAQRPLEDAPPAVRSAAAPSRLRRPALPPPLEPVPAARRWGRPVAIVAGALLVAMGGGVLAAALRSDDEQGRTVEALTRVPAGGSALVASPANVQGLRPGPIRLTNHAVDAVTWTAAADAPWLTVSPAGGRLSPGQTETLTLRVASDAPEGELRGAVQISGQDGSATAVRLEAAVEHPPDVAATIDGCTVAAVVEDEGEVGAVELHWYEPTETSIGRAGSPQGRSTERIASLGATPAGFTGTLPSLPVPVTWWVVAADARGNRARTADEVLLPGSCTPPAP
jgi:hypothetical protein